jgi:hypothetical protein
MNDLRAYADVPAGIVRHPGGASVRTFDLFRRAAGGD